MTFQVRVPKYPCGTCKEERDCRKNGPLCSLRVKMIEQLVQPGKIRNFARVLERLNMRFDMRKDGRWSIVPGSIKEGV
jgi:hypothetical protein